MRTWGRIDGVWQAVTTDINGNDAVFVTTLVQCLKLNRGESPFNGNYGIPAQQSVQTQDAPDYFIMQTQSQFAQFFASLIITRRSGTGVTPYYNVNILTRSGAQISHQIPI